MTFPTKPLLVYIFTTVVSSQVQHPPFPTGQPFPFPPTASGWIDPKVAAKVMKPAPLTPAAPLEVNMATASTSGGSTRMSIEVLWCFFEWEKKGWGFVVKTWSKFDLMFLVFSWENFWLPKKKRFRGVVQCIGCVMWLERLVVELMLWNIVHMEKRGEIIWFQVVMGQKPIPTEDALTVKIRKGFCCDRVTGLGLTLLQGDLESWVGQHSKFQSTVGLALSNHSNLGSAWW